jgi:hypothetical protein
LLGDVLQTLPDQITQLQAAHHRGAHRDRARADAVFLVARQVHELSHARQRVSEPRHRGARQPAAIGYFQIAESRLVALETSEHVERARDHLNDVTLACEIAGEQSGPAQPFRASSHRAPHVNSALWK